MTIGAIARMGMVCEAMIHGIRLRSSVVTWTMPTAIRMPSAGAEGKAEQRRGERHPGMIDEAAVAGDFTQEGVLEEVRGDLMRRRQRRLRLRQRLADELDDAGVSPARRSRSRWNGALRMTAHQTTRRATSPARIVRTGNGLLSLRLSVHAGVTVSPRRSGRRLCSPCRARGRDRQELRRLADVAAGAPSAASIRSCR